ncbi:MAG: glutamyl/glutaminyl-tRNA synthetase [Granulosicoccus sp.]|jgi:glutamyl/glutaminyl-tRNA synthetase
MSFVITAAIAKQRNAELLLRIDNLDSDRVQPDHVTDVFESLEWLGITWIEGPRNENELSDNWSQSNRILQYDLLINRLLDGGHLYPCDCSRKEIADRGGLGSLNHDCRNKTVDQSKLDVSWRIKLPEDCVVEIQDEIRGKILVDLKSAMPDFVIRRRDGIPSYQIASLADDLHFGIDLIIRGEDLLASTAAQSHLAELLGESEFSNSTFIHHPLIKSTDGLKLSKSAGSDALKTMRQQDMKPESVYEMIANHLGMESSVYDLNSFAEAFDPQLHLRG